MINVTYVDANLPYVELWIDNKTFYYHDRDSNACKILEGEYAHIPLRYYDHGELFNAIVFMNNIAYEAKHQTTVYLDETNNRAAIGTIIKE